MERHDHDREALDELEEVAQHKHPAQAEQGSNDSFAEGIDHKPDLPDEELESDFARGQRVGPEVELEHKGRFSEGIEAEPGNPENDVERRFSEGVERSPTSE